ncbi:hypothetical protein TTRE_0000399001 [Trichuris trichiura]|uniref:Uncharacterized protein n=1 Tax=Trichuris trichiura TaxID=36087 RepID=A0A077Z5J6_TRITR|nr:hypothetical protein TTRE_0000399001 [Trichuris trichiura]
MAASISLYKPSLIHALSKDSRLRLYWVLGKVLAISDWKNFSTSVYFYFQPSDSLELSVYAKSTKIDLFFVYNNDNSSWVGGMIPSQRRKLRWLYPKISRLCRAELLGELFSVPCNVVEVLNADYGTNWSRTIEDKTFIWYKSHRNVQHLEKYSDTEWKRVFQRAQCFEISLRYSKFLSRTFPLVYNQNFCRLIIACGQPFCAPKGALCSPAMFSSLCFNCGIVSPRHLFSWLITFDAICFQV